MEDGVFSWIAPFGFCLLELALGVPGVLFLIDGGDTAGYWTMGVALAHGVLFLALAIVLKFDFWVIERTAAAWVVVTLVYLEALFSAGAALLMTGPRPPWTSGYGAVVAHTAAWSLIAQQVTIGLFPLWSWLGRQWENTRRGPVQRAP